MPWELNEPLPSLALALLHSSIICVCFIDWKDWVCVNNRATLVWKGFIINFLGFLARFQTLRRINKVKAKPFTCTQTLVYILCQDSEQRTFIYIKGCVPQFEKWLQDNLTVVAGIFIGIALLQVRHNVDGLRHYRISVDVKRTRWKQNRFFYVLDFWHLFSAESRERHWRRERELVGGSFVSIHTQF